MTAVPAILREGANGLAHLVDRLGAEALVLAAIESMSGARFVCDQLELAGVRIADAPRVRGLAPLAGETDRIAGWVLAEFAPRDLLLEVWLPDPAVHAERLLEVGADPRIARKR
jgi:hypothetical protein